MSNYAQLMSRLEEKDEEVLKDSLKKLIYLTVNDQRNFQSYVGKLVKQLPKTLSNISQPETKLLSLQLMSEMATNFQKFIPSHMYDFPQLISFLSDENAQVRIAAHYLLLTYVKKYQEIDAVLKGYHQKIQTSSQQWKTIQKVIHSFQGLLTNQPRCVTYGKDYQNMDGVMEAVLEQRNSDNKLVKKASEQAVISFIKNEYVPKIVANLKEHIIAELKVCAEKNHLNFQAPIDIEHKKKNDMDHLQLEEINLNTNFKKPVRQSKASIELKRLVNEIDSSTDWKLKCDAVEQISSLLAMSKPALAYHQLPEDMLEKILELTYDYNFKTCITAMNVLLILINDYPDITVDMSKEKRLEEVVVDKVCDIKMAVRQIACKILRKVFYGNKSKFFLKYLLSKMNNCSVIGKQEILNFLQEIYTNSQPNAINNDSQLPLIVSEVSALLSNQNTRIKIKAIDCLVRISESTDPEECKRILQKKLNKVYYDMYIERLREKSTSTTFERWDDKKTNINKGATWQGQSEKDKFSLQMSEKPFMTKVEFNTGPGNRRLEDNSHEMMRSDEVGFEDTRHIARNFNDTKTTNRTANTFNTFNSTENSISNKLGQKKKEVAPIADSAVSIEDYDNSSRNTRERDSFGNNQSQESKKAPMKPTPVKKRGMEEGELTQQSEDLVIQSKEYMNKNVLEEIKQEKPVKMMKFKSKPKERREISMNKEEEISQTQTKPMFSSQSKKQHQIDYKATQYISKEQLLPADSPKDLLRDIINDLPKQNEWNKQFEGLNGLRRLIKHHQDFYPSIYQALPSIMPEVLKLVQSLRSTLAKNGMMTLSQMCEALKKSMDPFLEGIFAKLFRKALDTNTFIIEEVHKCMASLCSYCSNQKICSILLINAQNKSMQVKVKVILCIDKLIARTNYSLQLPKENPKLVGILSSYIMDGSAEVRNGAKSLFLRMGEVNSKTQIENLFKRSSSRDAWEKWKTLIDKQLNLLTIGSHKRIEYD